MGLPPSKLRVAAFEWRGSLYCFPSVGGDRPAKLPGEMKTPSAMPRLSVNRETDSGNSSQITNGGKGWEWPDRGVTRVTLATEVEFFEATGEIPGILCANHFAVRPTGSPK